MKSKRAAAVGAGVLALAAGLAVGPAAPAALGQASGGFSTQPADTALTPGVLGSALARLAIFDLRATSRPGDADYRIAATLLGLAREQRPRDTEILRKQMEAAWGAGDTAQVQELTRALLALEPDDTVAQLRLITASIAGNNQTAEQRLAAYEKFLGPEGKAFRPEVRSRLALDAALLLRERGDSQGFVDHLKLAMKLDPSHKEAAALAVAFFSERLPEDRIGRLLLLQNLLMADPVDPHVHLSIARELATGGAFKGAGRFYSMAMQILSAAGAPADESLRMQALVLRWHELGPAVVAREIREGLTEARAEASRTVRRFEGSPSLPQGVRRPEDIHLPASIAALAIAAGDAAGQPEAVRWAYSEFAGTLAATMEALRDPEQRGDMGEEQVTRSMARAVLEMCTVRVWSGLDVELVGPDLEKNPGLRELFPQDVAVVDGWLKLRGGDAAAALEILRPLQDTNVLARVGVGLAHENAGQKGLAGQTYEAAMREAPLSHLGAWSRSRLVALGWEAADRDAAALERAAEQIPEWIGRAITHPRQFLELTITPLDRNPDALGAVPLRVTLQNLSPVPLALGPDRALNSRLLLAPKIDTQAAVDLPWFRPEIVDIDRRLRLAPRERLEVIVSPELGGTGWAMEALGNRSLRVRWRATQGFIFAEDGGFRPGVMCLTADSESVVRRPLSEAALPPTELLRIIATGAPADLSRVGGAIRAHVMQPLLMPSDEDRAILADPTRLAGVREKQAEMLRPLAEALAARYTSLPPEERAALVALVPHAGLAPALTAFDEVVRGEEHPLPLAAVLVTRVKEPTDELLAKAGGSADPVIRQLAFALAERLGGEEPVYARLTADSLLKLALREPAQEAER